MRWPRCADFVAEVFCPSECVRLMQDQASMRNVDSRIHSLRFDCCIFLFYSLSAMTFATRLADCVAKRFCASECARLIQDQGSRYKVDSRIQSPRFDCCVFLFYSFSAVTFATESARRVGSLRHTSLGREWTRSGHGTLLI